jgi:hypothetical protein
MNKFEVGERVYINYNHEIWKGPGIVKEFNNRRVTVFSEKAGIEGSFKLKEIEKLNGTTAPIKIINVKESKLLKWLSK